MQFLLGLVAGLIIGWIIEWIIDWQYWRTDVDAQGGVVERTAVVAPDLKPELEQAHQEIGALRDEIARLSTRSVSIPATVQRDRLERIHGIGPVFARRLNEAGIYTFFELAQATPDFLRIAVRAEEWQAIDPAAWIVEAASFASKPDEGG